MIEERFQLFAAVWVLLGVGMALFMLRGSPETKRTWFPRLAILTGVAFVGFVYWIAHSTQMLIILIPVMAVITYMNIRFTKFCASCGTYHQNAPFYTVRFCRKCGQSLESNNRAA